MAGDRPGRIPVEEISELVNSWPRLTGYARAIAERYGVPLPTAYRWIAETRRRGLLARAGEHPCPTCGGSGLRTWGRRYD